ncbi:MAG: universal stress protein [Flavobacterium sp. JAD_PAG50586_2]|nr:MAG: universal stress protein [Flavobacterium sp. JAD_PAG50586_2]
MKKILVPVDFSANSNKSIRFALQLAVQSHAEVIFYHVVSIMAPTVDAAWDFTYYAQFQQDTLELRQKQLTRLVKTIYNAIQPQGVRYSCICELNNAVSDTIIKYAKKQKIDFICAGARGTGFMAKLFGTVATHLITHSPVPVFVIPKNYRLKPISDLCYASDMENPDIEIKKVLELSRTLHASAKILHFDYAIDLQENHQKLSAIAKKYQTKTISFHYKKLNALYPLHDHLKRAVASIKPSLLVLFTRQDRNWFDRMLLSSESAELSFASKVPLLVFRKNRKQ